MGGNRYTALQLERERLPAGGSRAVQLRTGSSGFVVVVLTETARLEPEGLGDCKGSVLATLAVPHRVLRVPSPTNMRCDVEKGEAEALGAEALALSSFARWMLP